jgi:hypothetical protein
MADLNRHQKVLLSFRSDTARVSYSLQNFSDIRQWHKKPWDGWKLIKNQNHAEIAICLLRKYWGDKKSISSIFRMADKLITLCGIEQYSWSEK